MSLFWSLSGVKRTSPIKAVMSAFDALNGHPGSVNECRFRGNSGYGQSGRRNVRF
jgi:hypothetical protein